MKTAAHLFCGIGGGELGFQRRGFQTVGAFDNDPLACLNFERITGSKATCVDISKMSPADLRDACTARPDVIFTSAPCQGFSGCLPEKTAALGEYQELNELAWYGIWLVTNAWKVPPKVIAFENVPRITVRGPRLLAQIEGQLREHGYAVDRRFHDCGEIGELAQHRRRFLLLARHVRQVPVFIRLPEKRRVRGIGEVLRDLPVPVPREQLDDPAAEAAALERAGGRLHVLPKLSSLNWLRLALIPAGGDWRDLPRRVQLPPRAGRQNGPFGVESFDSPAHAVLGYSQPRDTFSSIADPRITCSPSHSNVYGVEGWCDPSHAIRAHYNPRNGPATVADPRVASERYPAALGVLGLDDVSPTIRGTSRSQTESIHVADPRIKPSHHGCYGMQGWDEASGCVRGEANPRIAEVSVADPRLADIPSRHAGTMGTEAWDGPSHTITGQHGRRGWDSVADPRLGHSNRGGTFGVGDWSDPNTTIRATQSIRNGTDAVADPRLGCSPRAGAYGVEDWTSASHTITGHSEVGGSCRSSIADPRWAVPTHRLVSSSLDAAASSFGTASELGGVSIDETTTVEPKTTIFIDDVAAYFEQHEMLGPDLDLKSKRPTYVVIQASDGTWHRPMTTLELAALQSFPTHNADGTWLDLVGPMHKVRKFIGNAVPPDSAEAIAAKIDEALDACKDGWTLIGSGDIWVRESFAWDNANAGAPA